MNAFHAVGVYVDELVGFEQGLNLRPQSGEQGMEFPSPQIAESKMNDPRWLSMDDDTLGKIRVFRDNYQFVLAGVLPKLRICRARRQGRSGINGRLGVN